MYDPNDTSSFISCGHPPIVWYSFIQREQCEQREHEDDFCFALCEACYRVFKKCHQFYPHYITVQQSYRFTAAMRACSTYRQGRQIQRQKNREIRRANAVLQLEKILNLDVALKIASFIKYN